VHDHQYAIIKININNNYESFFQYLRQKNTFSFILNKTVAKICVVKFITIVNIVHIRGVHRIGLDVYNPTIG
jgi:hypothetical protein